MEWVATGMDPERWKRLRDVMLFAFGLGGLAVMVVVWAATGRHPDYTLATICATFAGSPLFLRLDERRNGKNGR